MICTNVGPVGHHLRTVEVCLRITRPGGKAVREHLHHDLPTTVLGFGRRDGGVNALEASARLPNSWGVHDGTTFIYETFGRNEDAFDCRWCTLRHGDVANAGGLACIAEHVDFSMEPDGIEMHLSPAILPRR